MKKKSKKQPNPSYPFFDRDLSWLSFNERLLTEAKKEEIPLLERLKFLSIYSSNLDEFYRVRMPVLMSLRGISDKAEASRLNALLPEINETIRKQIKYFGGIIETDILQALKLHHYHLLYNEAMPRTIGDRLKDYFIHTVASYLQVVNISHHHHFFPENNKLYFAVTTERPKKGEEVFIVNIPSDILSRFYSLADGGTQYIVLLDDIVRFNLSRLLPDVKIISSQSFKATRDAELELRDEFAGNLAKKIERRIHKRDLGLASRVLYEPGMPPKTAEVMKTKLNLKGANFIPGGTYHNLKDLATLPLKGEQFHYEPWRQHHYGIQHASIFEAIRANDILLHPPYHTYETVLRFFNEAAIDPSVRRIYVTLYRVAKDSRIVNALISAAKNGKKVTVFVELKARFDEANNIKWSKLMKLAGVEIIESIPGLKVHAKLALVKRKVKNKTRLIGLFSTGNFNEQTARYYTDHTLMTADQPMLKEAEKLFLFLRKKRKPNKKDKTEFKHLVVGQFNLQRHFLQLIDREISNAKKGQPAALIIKLNNLEEKVMIAKLYEGSQAGVKISLLIRGICCLVPGVSGVSENITVTRIVDRYLEHGRAFIFHNNFNTEVFLGSADWMDRNIYRRIEVCFPIKDPGLKAQIMDILNLQLHDSAQAVIIDSAGKNSAIPRNGNLTAVRSQIAIGDMLAKQATKI